MQTHILEKELKHTLRESPVLPDESRLKNTRFLAGQELLKRQNRTRISFARFLQRQIPYIGWKIWGIQAIVLLLAAGIFSASSDYLKSPRRLIKLLLCLSVAVFMTTLPLLYRSARYRMQETEAASRFSSAKLLLARLTLIGAGDIALLSGIFLAVMVKISLPKSLTLLYLCFPFLLAGSGCLFMLGHLPPRTFFAGSLLFCTFIMLAFLLLPEACVLFLQQASHTAGAALCVLLFVFCAEQLRCILHASAYAEMQLD